MRCASSRREICAFVPTDLVLLSATKGLEPETNKRLSEILEEETGAPVVGAISGPNSMQDIIASRPTALVVASIANLALPIAAEAIALPTLRVFGSSDLVGVELAGALKNIVAIAAGIAAGLDLGDNARAFLIAIGLAEIQKLAVSLGACASTFMGLAGFGDLFLTTTSPHSRNHWVGLELGRGARLCELLAHLERISETAEGVNSIRAGRELAAPPATAHAAGRVCLCGRLRERGAAQRVRASIEQFELRCISRRRVTSAVSGS